VNADGQDPEVCGLCHRPITSGQVAAGTSGPGPSRSYHAVLEECGSPLALTPLATGREDAR
jgi:hypothetical protein